jgi:2-amino-4-hydroxy-6-hydroxymethyldihydropteridine diphosphokinase
MTPEVFVALGSNLPGAFPSVEALLEEALRRLGHYGLPVVRRSSLWRSAAWPDESEPPYLNAVALVETVLPPAKAMRALHMMEGDFGRARGAANAPRTLDLDLVAYGDLVLEAPGVHTPHPRAQERLFVMGPLAEIAPEWRHPVLGATAEDLAAAAPVGRDAAPVLLHCNR